MARRRNTIAQFVSFDMAAMATRIQGMSDAKLGAWWRKAVIDCCSGCIDTKVDPLIKERYDWAMSRIIETQEHNARMYQNRKNRLNDQEANDGTATTPRDSTTGMSSEDADIRKDSVNVHDADAGRPVSTVSAALESGTSSEETFVTTTRANVSTNEARQSLPAGELLERVENGQSDSHCADNSPAGPAGLFPEESVKKPYGTCKHVMLTDAEGHHLREVYGTDLALAIEILDAYLENNPKALKKYKNHAAVLRKGNWVWKEVQENKINATRLENATKNNKSFKQQDLDARTEFFSKSIFDKGIA